MNYGYTSIPEARTLALKPEDERDRCCIQLYHFVAASADLRGKHVLEVGSGRGGGASYVHRYLAPSSMTGVDFSTKAVTFCRQRHPLEGLTFEVGNAEALPFEDAAFDAVLNVESSHCYGSVDAFLREVRRVLRPGGFFLHADLRGRGSVPLWRKQLDDCGMKMLAETDITANVVAALDADNDRKSALIQRLIPKPLLSSFNDFAGMRGSAVYEGFRRRSFVYLAFKLQKVD